MQSMANHKMFRKEEDPKKGLAVLTLTVRL